MNIEEIEKKIKSLKIPKKMKLNKYTEIENTTLFFSSHIAYCKTYKNSNISKPYLERLIMAIKNLENIVS